MDRRIAFLHPAIVAASEQISFAVKKSRSDRNSALGKADPRLLDRNIKHRLFVESYIHLLDFIGKPPAYANLLTMSQNFQPGDFLVFQLEAGFALLRLLDVDEGDSGKVWHLAAYGDLFPDVDTAEAASSVPIKLTQSNLHIALTNRAFESTQVARISHIPLTEKELEPLSAWRNDGIREVSDRSVRLMLGLR